MTVAEQITAQAEECKKTFVRCPPFWTILAGCLSVLTVASVVGATYYNDTGRIKEVQAATTAKVSDLKESHHELAGAVRELRKSMEQKQDIVIKELQYLRSDLRSR